MMQRNLRLLTILGALSGSRFGMGIWVLYFLLYTDYAGIGLTEVLILGGGLLCEIPSGALADLWGRRRVLIAAHVVQATGFAALAMAHRFWVIGVGCLIYTVGQALSSGAFEALLYDSLVAEKRPLDYRRALARARAARLLSFAFAGACGGFLYAWQPWLPYAATALFVAAGAVVAWFLTEPARASEPWRLACWWQQTRQGLGGLGQLMRCDGLVRFTLLAAMVSTVSEEVLDDVLAVDFGFQDWQLGLFFAGVFVLSAFAANLAGQLPSAWTPSRLLPVLATIMALSLLLSPLLGVWLGGLSIALRHALRAVWDNLQSELLNQRLQSKDRATVLSAFVMLKNLPYAFAAYAIGVAMDVVEPTGFALWLGLGWLGLLTLSFIFGGDSSRRLSLD